MKIVFTTTNMFTSKLIRWVTEEEVSHCAIHFDRFVLHSSFTGTVVEYADSFYERNDVIYEVELPDTEIKFKERKGYDFGAILYLALKLSLAKIGIKLPKKNLWQVTGMYLCTEFITFLLLQEEDSMITPYKLYLKLKEEREKYL